MGKKIFFIFCFLILFLLYANQVVENAWIGDDIMFTLRSVLNFVNGYGLVNNVGERVQSFTHPLWFFCLSFAYLVTKNIMLTPYYLSIFVSLLTFILFAFFNRNNLLSFLIGATLFICSRSYIDYSTSGLESPLSHFLIVLLVLLGESLHKFDAKDDKNKLEKILCLFFCVTSLVFINRQDLILLIFPYVFCKAILTKLPKKTLLKLFLISTLPATLWEVFSVYYYGFPFPNTFYAKEFTKIPLKFYLLNGLKYTYSFILFDPLSVLAILFCIFLFIHKRSYFFASFGMFLYLIYIVYVGGDFMAGRFFTPVLLFGVLKFKGLKLNTFLERFELVLIVFILGLANLYYVSVNPFFQKGNSNGFYGDIADEKYVYFDERSLQTMLVVTKTRTWGNNWNFTGLERVETIVAGQAGKNLDFGPNVYILDLYGLNQALLTRIPPHFDGYFRTGHIHRAVPKGYIEGIVKGENLIKNKKVHDYYEHLYRVTNGKLNSIERFKSIFYLNFISRSLPKDVS